MAERACVTSFVQALTPPGTPALASVATRTKAGAGVTAAHQAPRLHHFPDRCGG